MPTILYVDDQPAAPSTLAEPLGRAGHEVVAARDAGDMLRRLSQEEVQLLVANVETSGLAGTELVELVRRAGHHVPIVLLVDAAALARWPAAPRGETVERLTVPVDPERLVGAVERGLEIGRLRREAAWLRDELCALRADQEIVATSAAMRHLLQAVTAVAGTSGPVLLDGERGVGKTLVARALHDRSDRGGGPFVTVGCAVLPGALAERALLGDAHAAGAVERARGGTLLLREAAALAPDLQDRLLHLLDDGGRAAPRLVVTTTHAPAGGSPAATARGGIGHRLGVLPMVVPPLSQRRDDLPLLVHRHATRVAGELGKRVAGVTADALEVLARRHWPENVRSLHQAVERAVVSATEPALGAAAFAGEGEGGATATRADAADGRFVLPTARDAYAAGTITLTSLNVDAAEAVLIRHALAAAAQNRTRAAELLGISVRTLRNKLNGPGRPVPARAE